MAHPEDVEILIHIVAPSRTSDDARYRELAAAYLAFQPHQRADLPETTSAPTHIPSKEAEIDEISRAHNPGDIFSSPESPIASFRSVLDNANSPGRFKKPGIQPPISRLAGSQNSTHETSSWETPPSVVQDSVPENDATTALLTTPTRVLEHYLQHFATPSQASRAAVAHRQDIAEINASSSFMSAHEKLGSSCERSDQSIIPCTPTNRPRQQAPFKKRSIGQSLQEGTHHNTPSHQFPSPRQFQEDEEDIIEDTFLVTEPATPQAARADSEPPPSKRVRRDKSDASPGALLRTSSDIGLHNAPTSSTRSITFLPKTGYGYDSLTVEAPEPSVGNDTLAPEDLITSDLAKLAKQLKIPKRYRPEVSTRELRPFERGYWLIDCRDWPQDLKTEVWVFLANFVGTGVAGWGVSCHRDKDFTSLRLYCWGLLVAHIYLLAYLASRRRVCFSTATWVDAGGDTVVKMPKKEGVWVRLP